MSTAVTKSQFRAKAERMFRSGNPDAIDATIEWEHGPVTVRWADGSKGMSGVFTATAAGFRKSSMHASFSEAFGWTVR